MNAARTGALNFHLAAAYEATRMQMNWSAPNGMLSSAVTYLSKPKFAMSVGPKALVTAAPMLRSRVMARKRYDLTS
jgi:hypothetical protein